MKTLSSAKLVKENWGFVLFIFLMFASRSSLADWYHVPTGSMIPTIKVGDRVLVDKMAYRLEVPFTDISLMEFDKPQRGDIVVFNSKVADTRLIKRVIAIEGDQIAMVNNRVILNGKPLSYTSQEGSSEMSAFKESLTDVPHTVQFVSVPSARSSFKNVTVPQGHVFVMGDNRNNSADSRFIGFVPLPEIQGKAHKVIVSLDSNYYYLPRSERTFSPLI